MKINNYLKQDKDCSFTERSKIQMPDHCCSKVIPYFHVGRVYTLPLVRRKQFGIKENSVFFAYSGHMNKYKNPNNS